MGAIADFKGRQYDLSAFRDSSNPTSAPSVQRLFGEGDSGEIIVGVRKLSQRVLLELLTAQGSIPFLPNRGTTFTTAIRRGRLRTEADVISEFNFAAVDLRNNLVGEESDDMPDDERFLQVELTNISILPGFLSITIEVTSLAEGKHKVIVPLPIVI